MQGAGEILAGKTASRFHLPLQPFGPAMIRRSTSPHVSQCLSFTVIFDDSVLCIGPDLDGYKARHKMKSACIHCYPDRSLAAIIVSMIAVVRTETGTAHKRCGWICFGANSWNISTDNFYDSLRNTPDDMFLILVRTWTGTGHPKLDIDPTGPTAGPETQIPVRSCSTAGSSKHRIS
jgi:hypothetical protein